MNVKNVSVTIAGKELWMTVQKLMLKDCNQIRKIARLIQLPAVAHLRHHWPQIRHGPIQMRVPLVMVVPAQSV